MKWNMDLTDKRILIVKPSSMGDVVHTLPLVHALKRCRPSSHIGWIVQESLTPLIRSDPAVDEIITISIPSTSDPHAPKGVMWAAAKAVFRDLKRLRRSFASNPYDLVLDLHASFRSGLFSIANPDGLRIGFADAKELNTFFQHEIISPDPHQPHAVDKNLCFAMRLGCEPRPEDFHIVSDQPARDTAKVFIRDSGAGREDTIVYANPCARWVTKHWNVAGWAHLADMLIQDGIAKVIFGGGPQDRDYIQAIVDRMSKPGVTAAGKLDLGESIALIDASDIYVGVDSGPMHIAALAGKPVAALFGPTDPAKVGPYGNTRGVIRRAGVDCLGCRKRSCKQPRCMDGILPQDVYQRITAILP